MAGPDPEYRDELVTGDGTRDWARFDTSDVPHQGGYVAKQCPVRAQNDFLEPAEPIPVSAAARRRIDAGIAFEEDIADKLAIDVSLTGVPHRADREKATIEAMEAAANLIHGGRLPTDHDSRRVGEPDLLVRDPSASSRAHWSYRPADIKHHLTLKEDDSGGATCGDLVDVSLDAAAEDANQVYRRHKSDLMQLAHYQRMLGSCGWASSGGRWGGIVGKEERVVWTDLDDKIWRTPAVTKKTKMRSTIDVYDFEFAFRLDIIAAAMKYNAGETQPLLVVPVRNSECPECPWKAYCDESLEDGAGDISLIPGLGWNQWKVHRDTTGFTRRDRLASLDWETADLMSSKVDVAKLLDAAQGLSESTPIEQFDSNARRLEALAEHGVKSVGGLGQLSLVTARYSGKPVGSLPTHIDLARAALSDYAAFRLRGVETVEVPRDDVELDVDMESTDNGAYMWGTLLTDRAGSGLFDEGYRAFVAWDNAVESFERVFDEFWEWLEGVRSTAGEAGLGFSAYCYHAVAENTQMLKLAGPLESNVRDFIGSDEWIDLLTVVRRQLLTGESLSLKNVAPLASFDWEADDPSGQEAIVRYDVASSLESDAEKARDWLLEYNRSDVSAMLAVREWLEATGLPSITELDAKWGHG